MQLVGSGHQAQSYSSASSNISYGRYNVSYLDSLPYTSYSFCALSSAFCTISNSVFDGNSALLGGGGLSVLQGYSVQLTNVSFTDSTTPLYGGAIAVANGSAVFSTGCTFTGCTASQGGAVYAVTSSEAYIAASVIPLWRNAFIYASDVYKLGRQMGSAVTLTSNKFKDNVATGAGGAVYMSGDNQFVSQGNTFSEGRAGTQGTPNEHVLGVFFSPVTTAASLGKAWVSHVPVAACKTLDTCCSVSPMAKSRLIDGHACANSALQNVDPSPFSP